MRTKAQALLEEAGVSDLTIELAAINDKTSQLTCQIVQALLGAIGVTVEIKTVDDGVYWTLGDKSSGETWKIARDGADELCRRCRPVGEPHLVPPIADRHLQLVAV